MFDHLNRSNTNRDDRSRQETFEGENLFQKEHQGEPSDKVSFNLNNLSHIKPTEQSQVKAVLSNSSSKY